MSLGVDSETLAARLFALLCRWLSIALVTVGLSLATPGSARAQSGLSAEAEQAFQRGVVAAQQGQWTVALRYFDEARKTAPHQPQILFNLGLGESKLPSRELRAAVWLRAYLATSPRATNEKAVRELIEALDVRLEGALEKILRQTRDLALQLPAGFDRDQALRQVGQTQVAMGDFAAAKETVARMASDDTSGPGRVAEALAEAGDVAGAKRIVAAIKESFHIHRSSAYANIAVTQARAGDVAGAEATLAEARNEDYRIGGLFGVAQVLFQTGRKAEAAAWVMRAKDAIAALPASPRASYYPRLGQMQAAIDDIAGALQTASLIPPQQSGDVLAAVSDAYRRRFDERLKAGDLAEARRLATAITTPAIRSGAYLALHKNRLAAGDWDESLRALDEVADTDSDTANSYADLAQALVRAGDRPRARQVLARAAGRLGKMNELFVGYLVTANIAAGDLDGAKRVIPFLRDKQNALLRYAIGQAEAGDLAGAKQTIAGMQKDHQHDRALTIVADRELAAGNIPAAVQTLSMTADPKARSYRKIAEAQLAAGDLAGALRHAAAITDVSGRSFLYTDIARGQLEHGQLDAALATVLLIPSADVAKYALWPIARWQADQGDVSGALATANRIADEPTRLAVYLDSARAQLAAGHRQGSAATAAQAKALVDGMKDPGQQPLGYMALADFWLHHVGSPALARQSVGIAKSAVGSVADPAKRVELLTRLAATERLVMRWTDSRQSLLLATETAASMDPGESRNAAYKTIASAHAASVYLAAARETAARIASESDRNWALASGAWTYKSAGNAAALRELIAVLTAQEVRESVQSDLAQVLAQQGDRAAAAQIAAALPPTAYGRDNAYHALALAHAKAGDLAAARAAAAEIRGTIHGSDLFVTVARAGDVAWAEQNLRLVYESGREHVRAQVAGARAAGGDLAGAATMFSTIVDLRAKAYVCEGMAAAGDVRAATDCAARLPTHVLRVPVMLRLAQARAERGDLPGAQAILSPLRTGRPGIDLLLKIASAQVASGDEKGASQTLELMHPNDAEFVPWAAYVVATSQPATKLSHATALARGIVDPYWRDRALLALLPRATEQGAAEALVAAVTDALSRSQGRLEQARRELKSRGVAAALKQAEQVVDADAQAITLAELASSGHAGARGAATVVAATSLADGPGKAYLLLDFARARLDAGDAPGAAPLLRAAEPAVRLMTDSLWRARAHADLAQMASQAGATAVAQAAMRLARDTGDRLPEAQKARWLAYLNRPPVAQEAEEARAAVAGTERAKAWTELIEGDLKGPAFTDLAGHLQSISAQTKSKDMVDGLTRTADSLIDASKKVKAEAGKQRDEAAKALRR